MAKKTSKNTGQFDKIFKENAEAIYQSLIKYFLKIDLSNATDVLLTDIQKTIERKADFLKKITPTDGSPPYILHIEIQSDNDTNMPARMLLYDALIAQKYGLQVVQFVIYIGNDPLTMHDCLVRKTYTFSYNLIDIRRYEYEEFLQASTPEEVILAILGDFKGEQPVAIIDKILLRLQAMSKTKLALGKYSTQLSVISKLRKMDKETLTRIQDMPITIDYDVTDLPAYAIGKAEGKAEGNEESEAMTIQKMFQKGFKPAQIADILDIPLKRVNEVLKK